MPAREKNLGEIINRGKRREISANASALFAEHLGKFKLSVIEWGAWWSDSRRKKYQV